MKLDQLLEPVRKALLTRNETLSVAESVTSGNLQAALSLATDTTLFFQGGITVYNLGQKCRQLGVDPILGEKTNCIAQSVADTMAKQVCNMFCSDWGIGITGYAAPVPEQGVTETLFAFYSIAYRGQVVHSDRINTGVSTVAQVQKLYVEIILAQFAQTAAEFNQSALFSKH